MSALFKKYLAKARQDLLQHELEDGLKAVNSALHMKPGDLEALRCKIDILLKLGHFQKAADHLMVGLEQHPFQSKWMLELSELMINRLHQPSEALRWLSRVFRARGVSEEDERRAYRLQVEAMIDQERLYEAWLVLRKACTVFPEEADLLFLRGWVTLQLGRYYASASTFQKLLRIKPEHVDAHYYLGVAYEGMGEASLMLRQFSHTHKLDQVMPPQLRLSASAFRRIAERVLDEMWPLRGAPLLCIRDYPDSSQLAEAPHDPRRMGMLSPNIELSRQGEQPQRWRLTFYQWNIERFCFTPEEIEEEMVAILRQECEDKGLSSSMHSYSAS
ncbi:MAG TPA: hypothetical protein DCE42_07880 [Myxococcales bacterium]|nr:hypothetical protein [Deltaproteobacteria bacterium]HAA54662.1 hypothetical protein [Myxococcales bacterium]